MFDLRKRVATESQDGSYLGNRLGVVPPPEPRITAILDAALEHFAAVGYMKTSMADVARRAGIDRVTVYRSVGGATEVREAALALAGLRIVTQIEESLLEIDGDVAQLEHIFVAIVVSIRSHPVLVKALEVSQGEALADLSRLSAVWLAECMSPITEMIKAARAGGHAPVIDDVDLAGLISRLIHSAVVFPDIGPAMGTEEEVRGFVRRSIVPLVTGHSADAPGPVSAAQSTRGADGSAPPPSGD